MNTLWVYMVVVVAGIAIGYALPVFKWLQKSAAMIQQLSLYFVMLLMGGKLGLDPNVFEYIGTVGLQAVVLCAAVIVGSVAAIVLLERFLLRNRRVDLYYEAPFEESGGGRSVIAFTLVVLAFLAAGVLTARLFLYYDMTAAQAYLLNRTDLLVVLGVSAMIFTAGIDVGQKKSIIHDVRRSGWGMLIVPVGVLIGSTLAAVLAGAALGLTPAQSSAVGGSCGWYTIAGVVLSELDIRLGALAFLTNLLREITAMVITPFVAKRWGPFAAAGPAGATSMDSLLLIIVRSTSPANAIVAFTSGVLLTILIPFILSFFTSFL